jgi:hypothetical protein
MKTIILTFISLLFFSCGQIGKNKTGKLLFSAQIDKWEKLGDVDLLQIKTVLSNTTTDTVTYVSMLCSWEDAYTIDNNDLTIFPSLCERNAPMLIKIHPGKTDERILNLTSKKKLDQLRNIKFRIGFNFVIAKDYKEMFDKASELKEMKNVIWSDTLQLK